MQECPDIGMLPDGVTYDGLIKAYNSLAHQYTDCRLGKHSLIEAIAAKESRLDGFSRSSQ
ncbi:hypothetical protein [Rhizobium phage RHEph12]|nr:hypothetical protein [Rhizobium phage RHEph12]